MSKQIMVVDDEKAILTMMSILLRRQGFEVVTASSAREALEHVRTHSPDLFLLDVMMPGKSGIQLCEELRALPESAQIPVIVLSALNSSVNLENAICAGADVFLPKTTSRSELLETIQRLLNGAVRVG